MSRGERPRTKRPTTSAGLRKINTTLPPSVDDQIDELSAADGAPRSLVVRQLVEDGLRVRRVRDEAARGALALVASGSDEASDVSSDERGIGGGVSLRSAAG